MFSISLGQLKVAGDTRTLNIFISQNLVGVLFSKTLYIGRLKADCSATYTEMWGNKGSA